MGDVAGGPHVVLLGLMGSGKTTIGRELAARLGRPFLDSDVMVRARTGHTVAEIHARSGESAMREAEAVALADALASTPPAVVAAAAGVVLDEANRRRLRSGPCVVWLRVDPAVLAARLAGGSHRPHLGDDPLALLSGQALDRDPLYRDLADLTVDVDDPPAATAAGIVAALPEACRLAGGGPGAGTAGGGARTGRSGPS